MLMADGLVSFWVTVSLLVSIAVKTEKGKQALYIALLTDKYQCAGTVICYCSFAAHIMTGQDGDQVW